MKYSLFFVLLWCTQVSIACLNEEHVTKSGKYVTDAFVLKDFVFYKSQDIAAIQEKLDLLIRQHPTTPDDIRSYQNDIAVQYIKLGRLKEAEDILQKLIKQYPDNYSVNANLGTLYELQGKNADALRLIKKSVSIDPKSHFSSEWFHIKILEFKIKHSDNDKIAQQNILGIDKIKNDSAIEIAEEVRYQLTERIPFTPAPDIMMAKVLQEYAGFLADKISIEGAYIAYEIGMNYDPANVLHLKESRDALIPYFHKYHVVVPVTGNYYLDKIIPHTDKEKLNTAVSLIDMGLNMYKKQEEEKQRKENLKNYLVWGGAVSLTALLAGLFMYRRKKQSA